MGKKTGDKSAEKSAVRLSLCLIARDEAEFLEQCLGSVAGLADEIVVVDTGSSDRTIEVAQGHGARVLCHTWQNDFSAARNPGLEAARGEWILVLDCDEVLARGDHDEIRRLLEAPRAEAYRLTTRNYSDEANRAGWRACEGAGAEEKHYRGWFPTTKVRLWRRRPEVRFEGAVHELVEHALLRLGARIGDCMVPVHHYGYAEKERPQELYLSAGERKVRRNPADLNALYELAIAYRNAGRLQEARRSIEAVVEGLERGKGEAHPYLRREFALLVRADILDRLRLEAEAEEAYRLILAAFPDSYQALNNLGTLLERRGALEEAKTWYARGARSAPDNRILAENLERLRRKIAGGGRRLSVCVIARDEEVVLGRCLQSVAPVADEVVVVDTGSKDGSVEIARRHGARIGHFAWCDDFAAARNAALELATGEWILWLDADDYLLPPDQQKLARARWLEPARALYFTLVNEGEDRSRFRQVKMFPNRPEIRFERPVHETVMPALRRLGLPVVNTDIEVRHTGYARPEVAARKARYYLGLMEKWLARHPGDHYIGFRCGHTYYTRGEYARAREYFQGVLAAGCEAVQPVYAFRLSAVFQGRCLLAEGRLEEAIAPLEEALRLQPDEVLANLSIGDVFTKLGRCAEAVPHLRRALEGVADPLFPLDLRLIRYSAQFFLGQCHRACGRHGEALAAFEAAQGIMPERGEAAAALESLRLRHSGLYREVEETRRTEGENQEGGRQRLSLCMIVRDEEQRLGRCLESVRGLVDEVVVVDTGSKDGSVEIARRHGARIGHFAWCDDFAAARNAALELATGEWILWLDADDVLPGEHHEQIRRLLGQGRDKAYFFVLDDRGYENISCLQLRLFPRLPEVRFEMPVHEQVTPSLGRLGIETLPTRIHVLHTGYTTPEVVAAKKERYGRIMEAWLEAHPENYIVRSHVALGCHSSGRLDEAVAHYRAILYESACKEDRNWVVYTTALLFLGRTYLKKKEGAQALKYIKEAEERDPDYILTRLSLAETYAHLEDFEKALHYARAVIEGGEQLSFFPIDQREVRYAALVLSARAHQHLGRAEQAEQAFLRAAEVPVARRSEALGELAQFYKSRGDLPGALEVMLKARALDPEKVHHLFNSGVLLLELGRVDEAQAVFEQVLERQSGHVPAQLSLALIARSRGRFDEAEAIYGRLLETQPELADARAGLAHLYLKQERFNRAAMAFEAVRRSDGTLLDVNLGLLLAQAARGEWNPALAREILASFAELKCRETELDEAAGAARSFVQLGALLVRRNLLQCAEFAFGVAVALDPDCLEGRRCLAEIFCAQKNYWKAVSQYEALLLENPRDGEAFRRLGDCYRGLGVGEAAQMCYDKSRELSGV